ncbi:MAG: rhomboid family intramembrane serine protease [Bacteroidales bacterium]|nr:rhomboid family intramembrane serine protease [Bacteroidales bacterium]
MKISAAVGFSPDTSTLKGKRSRAFCLRDFVFLSFCKLGVGGAQPTVAHFAHLGGMLFGLIFLIIWRRKGMLR